MARLLKNKKMKIERKYKRLIGQTIDRMKDNAWDELMVELNKLKAQMKEEFEKAGIFLSEN